MSNLSNNRYNALCKAIIKHSIIVSTGLNDKVVLNENIAITQLEWLIVETIVEQRNEFKSMIELSRMIGLPSSTFSRLVGHLQKSGLIDKYRIKNNKKNIVLRPSEQALALYEKRTVDAKEKIWGDFFKSLDCFSNEDIEKLTEAFTQLNNRLPSARYSQDIELIKMD